MLLHVLGHVDARHRLLRVEHELRQRAGQLGLADAGRAEEQERADRAIGIRQPGARTAQRVGDGLDRLVLADDPLVQALLHVDELLDLALHEAADRDARPFGDDLGDVLGGDLLLQEAGVPVGPLLGLEQLALELRDAAVAQLGGALQIGLALGDVGLVLGAVERVTDLADDVGDRVLLGLPRDRHLDQLLVELGDLALERLAAVDRRVVGVALGEVRSISSCMIGA